MRKRYEVTRVYSVEAHSMAEARAFLAQPEASDSLAWESVVTLPVVLESTPMSIAKEALRQLTGHGYPSSTHKQEPRS